MHSWRNKNDPNRSVMMIFAISTIIDCLFRELGSYFIIRLLSYCSMNVVITACGSQWQNRWNGIGFIFLTSWQKHINVDLHYQTTTASLRTDRLMQRVSTFLPRDAMRKRGLCCRPVSVCLSVRPAVCQVGALYPDGWRYLQTTFSAR